MLMTMRRAGNGRRETRIVRTGEGATQDEALPPPPPPPPPETSSLAPLDEMVPRIEKMRRNFILGFVSGVWEGLRTGAADQGTTRRGEDEKIRRVSCKKCLCSSGCRVCSCETALGQILVGSFRLITQWARPLIPNPATAPTACTQQSTYNEETMNNSSAPPSSSSPHPPQSSSSSSSSSSSASSTAAGAAGAAAVVAVPSFPYLRPTPLERAYATYLLAAHFSIPPPPPPPPDDDDGKYDDEYDDDGDDDDDDRHEIRLSGRAAAPLLSTAPGVDRPLLRSCWDVVDPSGLGTLVRRSQFRTLLRLIALAQARFFATDGVGGGAMTRVLEGTAQLAVTLPTLAGLVT